MENVNANENPIVDGGAVVSNTKKAKAAPKATPRLTIKVVTPYLVALIAGKTSIKEVTKALDMSEAEVNKCVVDNFGLILMELGGVIMKLEGVLGYIAMMEKKPERSPVLMDMLKEAIEESCSSLSKMTGKGKGWL